MAQASIELERLDSGREGMTRPFFGERSRWSRRSTCFLIWLVAGMMAVSLLFVLVRDGDRLGKRSTWQPLDFGYLGMLVATAAAECCAMSWFLAIGSCLGSFLNVVVYRLPRGETLLGTSRCPRCGHSIRPRDNMPILGWWFLRGRCRDCHGTIDVRYPRIELLVGLVVLLLGAVDLAGPTGFTNGSWNLYRAGFVATFLDPNWIAWLRFGMHLTLALVLLAIGLMRLDQAHVPLWFLFAVTVVLLTFLMGLDAYSRDATPLDANRDWGSSRWTLWNAPWMRAVLGAWVAGMAASVCLSSSRLVFRYQRVLFVWTAVLVGMVVGPVWGFLIPMASAILARRRTGNAANTGTDAPYLAQLNWLTLIGLLMQGIARWTHDST